MAGLEAVLQDEVQRVLDAGEGLGGIVVLIVDVDVVVGYSLAHGVAQEALVHIALGGLRGKFHHHARGRVRVHVGVFSGDIVGLGLDNGLEDFVTFGLSCDVTFVAVTDVLLGHLLAGAVHQVVLNHFLDFFHGHDIFVQLGDSLGNLGGEDDILTGIGHIHGLQDGGNNLLVVEIYTATVTF